MSVPDPTLPGLPGLDALAARELAPLRWPRWSLGLPRRSTTEATRPAAPVHAPGRPTPVWLALVWRRLLRALERSGAILAFFALWELLPRLGVVSTAYLSPPSEILPAVVELAQKGQLAKHLLASLQRSLSGLAVAVVAGVSLGLLMGWFARLERWLDPLLQLFRQTSAFALFPVFLLFFGIGETSKIAIIFWASFWPVLLSTISGVKQVDKLLIQSALSMGAGRGWLFAHVVLPAAAPSIFTGVRLGGAYCITALVTAEMIGAHAGLGFLTLNSQEVFQIPLMYAGILLLAGLGLLLNVALAALEDRLTGWRRGLGHRDGE